MDCLFLFISLFIDYTSSKKLCSYCDYSVSLPASFSTFPLLRETLRKRTMENRPDDFKKDGKIHRLRTQEDSEDENNTWNGNSTQQM